MTITIIIIIIDDFMNDDACLIRVMLSVYSKVSYPWFQA